MTRSKIKKLGFILVVLSVGLFTAGSVYADLTLNATTVSSTAALTLTGATASTWSTTAGALTLTSAGAATWSTTAGVLTLTGTGGLTLDSGTTTAVNLGTGAAAKTITVGNAASTEVEVNALLVDINAGATGMTIDFGAGNLAITGAGASADFTLDSDLISIDATGTSNITVTGAVGEDFTIAQAGAADASLFLSSTGTGADALTITVSGASGDIQVDATAGTVIVDGGEAVADALLLRATGGTLATAHLTSNGTGTAAVDIDATGTGGDVDIDANDAIDLLAGGVFSIDGTGASNVSATSGNLTLSTITTGVLILSSAGNTTLDVAAGGLLSVDVAAPGLEVATANNISVAASNSIGVVAQTLVIELTGAEDDEDDFTVRAVGAEGDLLLTSGDDLLIDTVGLLELNSSAGVISIGNDAVAQNINIGTAGTRTIAVGSATTILNATAKVGSLVNLSAATNTTTAVVNNGLIIPISADCALGITEGQICWDSDNNVLYVGDAAAAVSVAGSTGGVNTWTDNQIFTFAGDEDIAISNTTATTVDVFSLTVTNLDADAAQISLTLGNDADIDTTAALNIAVTSAITGDADVLVGLNIANLTSPDNVTVIERALVIGSGWDANLLFADTTTQIQITDAGTYVFENVSGTDFLSMSVTLATFAGDLTVTGGDINIAGEASTVSIIDNTASAFLLEDVTAGADYILITTTNDAETMVFGHGTVDSITLTTDNNAAADVAITGGVTIARADTIDALTIAGTATTGDAIDITPGTARTSGAALLVTDASIAATVTGDLIQINVTGTPDTNTLDIDVSGIAEVTSNAIDVTYSVAALGNAIDLNMSSNVTGDAININSAATTGNAIEIDLTGATGSAGAIDIATVGLGAANVGAGINLVGTGILANADASVLRVTTNSASSAAASLVDLSSTGNLATPVADGAVLKITETGAVAATTYAVYISSTSNEALKVDDGVVVFDETLTVSGLLTAAASISVTGSVTATTFVTADAYQVTNGAAFTAANPVPTKADLQAASFWPVNTATNAVDIDLPAMDAADIGRTLIFAVTTGHTSQALTVTSGAMTVVNIAGSTGTTAEDAGDYVTCVITTTTAATCVKYTFD